MKKLLLASIFSISMMTAGSPVHAWNATMWEQIKVIEIMAGYIIPRLTVTCVKGDLNQDGAINDTDYKLLLQNRGRVTKRLSDSFVCAADFNDDGYINRTDVNAMQNLLAK